MAEAIQIRREDGSIDGSTPDLFAPSPIDAGLTKEVWISVRTDGLTGDGTLGNPFSAYGSSQTAAALAFDTLINTFSTYTLIHLAPGTYYTRGCSDTISPTGSWIKEGQHWQGAGQDITTIKVVDNLGDTGRLYILGAFTGVGSTKSKISDLTVDCNLANQSTVNLVVSGVSYFDGVVERVKVINWGCTNSGSESFTINVPKIRQCEVGAPASTPLAGGCTVLNGVELVGNYVHDVPTGGTDQLSYCWAMSVGPTNSYARFNRVENLTGASAGGVYVDSLDGTNIIISGNQFLTVTRPIIFNAPSHLFTNIDIIGNTFTVTSGNTAINMGVSPESLNLRISRNDITVTGEDNAVQMYWDGFHNAMVTENIVTRATGKATGTLTSDGTKPSNNDTVVIGTTTYTFKTSLTPTAGEVLIGAATANSLANLIAAINHTGTAGTDYANLGVTAVANTQVTARSTAIANAIKLFAITPGTAANSIATTETSSHLSFGAATLTGGVAYSHTAYPMAMYEVNSSLGYLKGNRLYDGTVIQCYQTHAATTINE